MTGFPDLFAPGMASALVLVALRVGGLLLVAPMWSARTVPMRLRTACPRDLRGAAAPHRPGQRAGRRRRSRR